VDPLAQTAICVGDVWLCEMTACSTTDLVRGKQIQLGLTAPRAVLLLLLLLPLPYIELCYIYIYIYIIHIYMPIGRLFDDKMKRYFIGLACTWMDSQ